MKKWVGKWIIYTRKRMHWLGDTPAYDNGSNGTSRRETYRNFKKRRLRGQE